MTATSKGKIREEYSGLCMPFIPVLTVYCLFFGTLFSMNTKTF